MKKKVLVFVPSLRYRGGSFKVAATLTQILSKKYDVSTITLFHFKKNYGYGGKYYTLDVKHNRGVYPKLYLLIKMIKTISPDIVVTFMTFTSFWAIPLLYVLRMKVPIIINVHSNPDMQYKRRIYFKFLIKFLYRLKKVKKIVPVSKELKEIFHLRYKIEREKLLPIYNGINIQDVLSLAKEKLDDNYDIFANDKLLKFISIGRLSVEKGHIYLIKAFSKVIKEIPNARLIIIGEGLGQLNTRPYLEQLIKKEKLANYVKLLGFQSNPYKYLSRSDILVLPSLNEALPYALIEAFALHIPIISTDCRTGPKELLHNGKYGLLTKVADANDLAQKMILLAKDEDLRKHYANISEEVIDTFDEKKFTENWLNLIESQLNQVKE